MNGALERNHPSWSSHNVKKQKKAAKETQKVGDAAVAEASAEIVRDESSPEARLERLETFVAALARDVYRKPVAFSLAAAHPPVADGGLVDVGLTKLDGSPSLVRVTVEGRADNALDPGADKGVVAGVPLAAFVKLFVRVIGNPGDTASISVTGAIPPSLAVSIPMDKGQTVERRSIFVTG